MILLRFTVLVLPSFTMVYCSKTPRYQYHSKLWIFYYGLPLYMFFFIMECSSSLTRTAYMTVCMWLGRVVVYKTAQNSSDNLSSHLPDNHHNSYAVCGTVRETGDATLTATLINADKLLATLMDTHSVSLWCLFHRRSTRRDDHHSEWNRVRIHKCSQKFVCMCAFSPSNLIKIDSCSAWGCTWCAGGGALTNFNCK